MPISGDITVPEWHYGNTAPQAGATVVTMVSGEPSQAGLSNEPIPASFRRWLGAISAISGTLGVVSGVTSGTGYSLSGVVPISGDLSALSGVQHELALRAVQLEDPGMGDGLTVTRANAILTASGEFS